MSTPSSFRINQTALGTYDVARRDILPTSLAGASVELEAETAGLTYLWEVTQPPGSAVALVGSTAQICTIAAEAVGGYIAKLTVDAGLPTESITRKYFGIGVLINGTRYPLPAITETVEDNSIGHPEYGWFDKIYNALVAMAAGVDSGCTWNGTTTNAVPTEIFVDGVLDSRVNVTAEAVTAYVIEVTAYQAAPLKGKTWRIDCAAVRDGANNSSLVDIPIVTILAQTDAPGGGVGTDTWDVEVAVNDPDDTLRLTVTGEHGMTIVWEAHEK